MSVFINKYNCCGCSSCMNVCPKHAISMVEDKEGFLYPYIDEDKCIECNLCKNICLFSKKNKIKNGKKPITYGVKHKNDEIRENSRSGGMFTAISDYILDKDGVVYGVGYKNHFEVCHKRATSKQERNEFRGSKYVQSNLNDTFECIKNDLEDNRYVLFSGTPCQVDALHSYLSFCKINMDKLITCDLICHGTPSPLMWREYIKFQEEKYKGIIQGFEFRNKRLYGWEEHVETFNINGKEYSSRIFTKLFYDHIILRPSCYKCPYTSIYRDSDITLGDFWGVDKNINGFNDNRGVSLILLNTGKGKKIFKSVKKQLNYELCRIEDCIQPALHTNFEENNNRAQFWDDYYTYGFIYNLKKYLGYSKKFNFIESLRYIIKKYRIKGE